jgi:Lyzozyme M1 (1,4-beta-N-acetylmuramidase)
MFLNPLHTLPHIAGIFIKGAIHTMKRFYKKSLFGLVLLVPIIIFCGIFFIYNKKILLNHPSDKEYPVRGIDISHYQGRIDWSLIEKQNIDFVFIKATEGSSCIDENFKTNWKNVQDSKLIIGAYHFFSFDSSAESQAENYITTVENLNGKLPPVIDFEYYGDKAKNPPKVDTTRKELHKLLSLLEQHYGVKPIIYSSLKTYHRYICNEFNDYTLWIRNVYYTPNFDLNGKWKFWQYTDTAMLKGYSGGEKYIDMNVFNGTEKELYQLVIN